MIAQNGGRTMRTVVIAALALASWSGAAAAQKVGGNYAVSGTNPNGSHYGGTAEITPIGSTCRIRWQTGSTSSSGACMLANKAFGAYYHLAGRTGMVLYELQPNGQLIGYWTIIDQEGVGTETLTPR
jgi:hypothetical protein